METGPSLASLTPGQLLPPPSTTPENHHQHSTPNCCHEQLLVGWKQGEMRMGTMQHHSASSDKYPAVRNLALQQRLVLSKLTTVSCQHMSNKHEMQTGDAGLVPLLRATLSMSQLKILVSLKVSQGNWYLSSLVHTKFSRTLEIIHSGLIYHLT
jgi:hypothetical protein